jgi:hypothetical protein
MNELATIKIVMGLMLVFFGWRIFRVLASWLLAIISALGKGCLFMLLLLLFILMVLADKVPALLGMNGP